MNNTSSFQDSSSPVRSELSTITGRPLRIVDPVEFAGPVTFEQLSETPLQLVPKSTTVPSVLNLQRLKFQNTSSVTITDFVDGQEGQYIIVVGDGQTIVTHGTNIFNAAGSNITLANNKVYAYVRVQGVWREQGGVPTPNLSFSSNALTSNAAIGTPGTFVTGASLALAAGTWLLTAHMTIRVSSTTPIGIVTRLTESIGSTTLASVEATSGTTNPNYGALTMTAIVALASSATITASASSTAASTIMAQTGDYSGGNTATQLTALRIA